MLAGDLRCAAEPMLELQSGQVDLWLTRPERIGARLAAGYAELLTADELAQGRRFYFAADRHRHRVTRALVRSALSRYVAHPPQAWRFASGAHGKPCLVDAPAAAQRLAFNISHTAGLVVVAIAAGGALGVDVENLQRVPKLALADRYFAASESRALRRLPAAAQQFRFWELWTLKESYVKARGMGLAIPLDHFLFHLETKGSVAIEFGPGFGDAPARWQFLALQPTAQHLLALCVETPPAAGHAVELVVREGVPLGTSFVVSCAVARRSAVTGLPRPGPNG